MKHQDILKHNLKILEDGLTIGGQILSVNWGEYEDYEGDKVFLERGGYNDLFLSKDFYVCSSGCPQLNSKTLYVFGKVKEKDDETIYNTFETKERAQEIMGLIDLVTIKEEGINIFDTSHESLCDSKLAIEYDIRSVDPDEYYQPKVIEIANQQWEEFETLLESIEEKGRGMNATQLKKLIIKLKEV